MKTKQQCEHCGYEWKSRKKDPMACPRCKRRFDYPLLKLGENKKGAVGIVNIILIISIIAIILSLYAILHTPNVEEISEQSTLTKILDSDEITVCYMTWPPSVIKDPNTGEVSGFIVDIFNEIAKDSELKVTYTESTWGGFPADLNTGKCDAAIAGIYPTIGRSTSVSFTKPFFFAGNSGVAKSGDNRFTQIEDLDRADVKIAVIQGEFGHIYAEKYLPKAKLVVLDKSADLTMPLLTVSSGQADVGLSTSDVVTEYVKKHPEVKDLFSEEPYSTTPISWATRSGDQELLNFLDNGISYLKSTGFLDATAKKYAPSGWFSVEQKYASLS